MRLRAATSQLILLGWQDRLIRLLPDDARRRVLDRATLLRQTAQRAGVPVHFTEVDPRSLGRVITQLAPQQPITHSLLSAAADPVLRERLADPARPAVVLAGLETHLSVAQSALDLLDQGRPTFVVADACAARDPADHEACVRRLRDAGVVVLTCEAALFEWVDDTTTPLYQDLLRLLRQAPSR